MINKRPGALAMAAAVSLAAHTAVLGGLIFWRMGTGQGSGAALESQKEIRVKIRQGTAEKALFKTKKASDRASYRSAVKPMVPAKSDVRSLSGAVSAARLLNDPETGLIFSVYFKTVRARLSREAATAKVPGIDAQQWAAARFVLDRKGGVISSEILSTSSAEAGNAAEGIVTRSAPFPAFPSAIHHEAISFEVRFRFDTE